MQIVVKLHTDCIFDLIWLRLQSILSWQAISLVQLCNFVQFANISQMFIVEQLFFG